MSELLNQNVYCIELAVTASSNGSAKTFQLRPGKNILKALFIGQKEKLQILFKTDVGANQAHYSSRFLT